VGEKVRIKAFILQSGDKNSEQYYPVSITAGENPGWHEMKYREL